MSLMPPLLGWLVVAVVAATVVASYLLGQRERTAGILVAVSWWSAITAPIGALDIRVEQPAFAAVAVLLLVREPTSLARVLRATLPLAVLVAVFLGVQFLSSALFAADPAHSLRIAAWMAFSAGGAWIVATLLAASNDRGRTIGRWLVASALIQVAVAVVQVGAQLLFESNWGVLRTDSPVAKTFGLSWEPNLLSIGLAVAACFAIFASDDSVPGGTRRVSLVLSVLGIGLGLALSRGGLVALAVGSGVALLLGLWRGAPPGWSLRDKRWQVALGRSVGTLVLGVAITAGLRWAGDMGAGLRPGEVAHAAGEGPPPSLRPVATAPTLSPKPSASPGPSGPPATPVIPGTTFYGSSDTIAVRLRNMQVAVNDALVGSPFIGLGTGSFGQRYIEPTCTCPSHIPNVAAATIYESGFVGFAAVSLAFAILLGRAIAVRRLDLVAALIVLLVGYQFTDALRFGSTWVLAGIAMTTLLPPGTPTRARPDTPPPSFRAWA